MRNCIESKFKILIIKTTFCIKCGYNINIVKMKGVHLLMNYSFLNLGEEVLRDSKVPLSVEEIWSMAGQKGLTTKLGSSGKTPVRTLSARLYMDIKNSENTIFVQVSKRPAKFFIK